MKILLVHNRYQLAGGEDSVFQADRELLEGAGHQVILYVRDNAEINNYSVLQKISLFKNTVWSRDSRSEIVRILKRERPQIAHFHNTFPLISPSAYYACKDAGVGVVQTLHNFRLLCSNSLFFRDGHICEDCLGKTPPWPGILHACYRNSRLQTSAVVTLQTTHRLLKTWQDQVDVYIALSEFSREKFIQGGLPTNKVRVKPNFIDPDPGVKEGPGDFALFVGRLSPEKGVKTLLEAWKILEDVPLKVVGDGPLLEEVQQFVRTNQLSQVEILGRKSRKDTLALFKQARFLVFPSECYENFPMVILEAFACGLPVIATATGAMQEIIDGERTGLHFSLSNPEDLVTKVAWLWSRPAVAVVMGLAARREFEMKYTAERNYRQLQEIYTQVCDLSLAKS